MRDKKILVFIPVYNCEKQITRVLRRFRESDLELFSEILVVDNRSQDHSVKEAVSALKKIKSVKTKLLQNDRNVSLGGSHKVAFEYCLKSGYDYCLVLHGDDQGDINDMVPFLRSGEYAEYDSLLGSRFSPGSKLDGYSFFRIFGNHVLNAICGLTAGRMIADMGSGLNIYSAEYLKTPFYFGFPDDLTFNIYLLFYGIWKKSRFAFFPIQWREDDQISNAKVFGQAFLILKFLGRYLTKTEEIFKIPDPKPVEKYTSKVLYESRPIVDSG